MKRFYKFLVILSITTLVFTSCEDALDTEPSSTVSQAQITELASSDPEALALILEPTIAGMYAHLSTYNFLDIASPNNRHDDYGINSILHICDLMGEDMVQTSGSYGWYWYDYLLDSRNDNYRHPDYIWKFFYRNIKMANDIIVQVPADNENPLLKAYRGQALVTRAYSYHYLVQVYQKTLVGHENDLAVPLVTEVASEVGYPRATMSEIYTQMVSDLTEAITLLDGYNRPGKGFIDKNVANGYLARVYLSMEEWSLAAGAANAARQGYAPMSGADYLDGFKYLNNDEWMFGTPVTSELDIVQSGIVNFPSFISSMSYGYAALTGMLKAIDKRLYDHMSATDIRKMAYQSPDGTTFPDGGYNGTALPAYVNGKFGASDDGADNTQDLVYMRAAEMYLIEAEALAAQGQTSQAATLLNSLIQTRDPNFVAPTDVLAEIRIQRRIELWGELGIALFDIKRLKQGINRIYDGSNHPAAGQLTYPAEDWKFTYQLPISEMDNNPDIEENNP